MGFVRYEHQPADRDRDAEPGALHALGVQLSVESEEALGQLNQNEELRVAVITGVSGQ